MQFDHVIRIGIIGDGFIGRNAAKFFSNPGFKVKFLSSCIFSQDSNITWYLSNFKKLNKDVLEHFFHDIDVVINCFGEIRDQNKMYKKNYLTPKEILDIASSYELHWIQFSSLSVYGNRFDGVIDESSDIDPFDEYSRSKLLFDEELLRKSKKNKFHFTILRPAYVFSNPSRRDSLHLLMKAIKSNIFFFPTRKSQMSFCHVDDLLNYVNLIAGQSAYYNKIYIIAGMISLKNLVGAISKSLGLTRNFPTLELKKICRFRLGFIQMPKKIINMTKSTFYSSKLIEEDTGYKIAPIELRIEKYAKEKSSSCCS